MITAPGELAERPQARVWSEPEGHPGPPGTRPSACLRIPLQSTFYNLSRHNLRGARGHRLIRLITFQVDRGGYDVIIDVDIQIDSVRSA